jgi:Ca2+-transporting ATPase
MLLKWEIVIRYFSGHTKNADGSKQFTAGRTKVGDAVDGAIKIITVAVGVLINTRLPEYE